LSDVEWNKALEFTEHWLMQIPTLWQIALTAVVTVIVGALSFSLGQVIVRGMVEPGLELKRTIGQIAHDLDFYANKIFDADLRPEFNRTFRSHWAPSKRASLFSVIL
jgi:hypothetical protein